MVEFEVGLCLESLLGCFVLEPAHNMIMPILIQMSVSIQCTFLFVLNCMLLDCCYKESCNCVLRTAVSCGPAPKAPANGQRSVSGTTFGSTVTYTCNRGYPLQGDSRRTCMANGQWSGVTTRCSRKHAC